MTDTNPTPSPDVAALRREARLLARSVTTTITATLAAIAAVITVAVADNILITAAAITVITLALPALAYGAHLFGHICPNQHIPTTPVVNDDT